MTDLGLHSVVTHHVNCPHLPHRQDAWIKVITGLSVQIKIFESILLHDSTLTFWLKAGLFIAWLFWFRLMHFFTFYLFVIVRFDYRQMSVVIWQTPLGHVHQTQLLQLRQMNLFTHLLDFTRLLFDHFNRLIAKPVVLHVMPELGKFTLLLSILFNLVCNVIIFYGLPCLISQISWCWLAFDIWLWRLSS